MAEKIVKKDGKFGINNISTGKRVMKQGYTLSDDDSLITKTEYEDYSETNEVLPCIYDEIIQVHPNIYQIRLNGCVGLFYGSDRNCFLLKNIYQKIELIEFSPLIVKADGKFGGFYFRDKKLISLLPDYDEIKTYYSFWAIRKKELWGLYGCSDGNFLADTKYRSVDVFDLKKYGYCPSCANFLIRVGKKFGAIGVFESNSCRWLEQPKHSLKKIEEQLKTKHGLKIEERDRPKLVEDKPYQKSRLLDFFRKT